MTRPQITRPQITRRGLVAIIAGLAALPMLSWTRPARAAKTPANTKIFVHVAPGCTYARFDDASGRGFVVNESGGVQPLSINARGLFETGPAFHQLPLVAGKFHGEFELPFAMPKIPVPSATRCTSSEWISA
jgi:hypothetical protein